MSNNQTIQSMQNIIDEVKEKLSDNQYLQLSNHLSSLYKNETSSTLQHIYNDIKKGSDKFKSQKRTISAKKYYQIHDQFEKLLTNINMTIENIEYKLPLLTNNMLFDIILLKNDFKENFSLKDCRENMKNYLKSLVLNNLDSDNNILINLCCDIVDLLEQLDEKISISKAWKIQEKCFAIVSLLSESYE
jgi:hypothetical protein